MNYKVKSLIYLFAFILSAILYHQMEQHPESAPDNKSAGLSMEQVSREGTAQATL